MPYWTIKKRCPICKCCDLVEAGRRLWVRFVPFLRLYRCAYCKSLVMTRRLSTAGGGSDCTPDDKTAEIPPPGPPYIW